ncbi:DNA-directed RNA polymerase II RPB9 [Besnoitia besnoiti]|uniref:DNA-directed RNA polymerase II RPB9 n=1 Tax=Besnoitia besnoiti TaxID=94643 RepID=A0A2A9M9D3_BESBE|nr:DNA-directed RNA polymerase II RPB9 [Besnoitia besnoiti]PFH34615.1 DNA-directed RNA polymerase II RPB9 [Besnoitia besnoiti]
MMGKSMMFCPECNNMLYPKEDKEKRQLQFLCRQCDYSRYPKKTDIAQHIVDRTNFNYKSKEDIVISSELSKDPTLGRVFDWQCRRCKGVGGVFYQLPERVAEDAMTLVYVCTRVDCGAWEIQQPDVQGAGASEDSREPNEGGSPLRASPQRARAATRLEENAEEDAADAGRDEGVSVKRPLGQDSPREDNEEDGAAGAFASEEQVELIEDDDLFGEREEGEEIFAADRGGAAAPFDEDEIYAHRPAPEAADEGERELDDVAFE